MNWLINFYIIDHNMTLKQQTLPQKKETIRKYQMKKKWNCDAMSFDIQNVIVVGQLECEWLDLFNSMSITQEIIIMRWNMNDIVWYSRDHTETEFLQLCISGLLFHSFYWHHRRGDKWASKSVQGNDGLKIFNLLLKLPNYLLLSFSLFIFCQFLCHFSNEIISVHTNILCLSINKGNISHFHHNNTWII